MIDEIVVAIVGQGYVGLPLAMTAAEVGHKVLGVEINEDRVAQLNRGISHIEDVSNANLLKFIKSKNYRATTQLSEISNCTIVVICVPTPLDDNYEPDLAALIGAIRGVAPFLSPSTLLVSESTSYPGTARTLISQTLREVIDDRADQILIASAPERVDPGNIYFDHTNTPRLISGLTPEATARAAAFYRTFTAEVIEVSSPEVAETAKLLENTFRQVNIALVNELAIICHKLGVDVREVIDAAATKPYGFMKFIPGAGVGGHCIPVDPSYLSWRARQVGAPTRFIDLANEVNREMPEYVAERLISMVDKENESKKMLIVGVAYKSGVGDTRESPAAEVLISLKNRGWEVGWHDPLVPDWNETLMSALDSDYAAAIVVTAQPGIELDQLISRGIPVLDCTGHFNGKTGVTGL